MPLRVNAFANLHIHRTIVDESIEFVLCHDCCWDDIYRYFHVLIPGNWSVQVEVLDVHAHHPGSRCGERAIDEQLDSDEACCFGRHITRVVDPVTANSSADSLGLSFLGPVSSDHSEVGGFAASWDSCVGDEMCGVGASGHVGQVALGESAKFVGTAGFPFDALGTGAERLVLSWVSSIRVDGLVGEVDGLSSCIKPIEVPSCGLQRCVFQGGTGGWIQVVVTGPESLVGKLDGWWCVL